MKPRVVREPRLHRGMLVCAVIVENEMDVPAARRLPSDRVQERDELRVRVVGLTAIDHVPFENIQGGKERGRAVPLVIMRLPGRDPGSQRQDRLRAVQRLNLALLIDRKSTRLNSSHSQISYAVFCLKKKKTDIICKS